jgi:hypothetical protein
MERLTISKGQKCWTMLITYPQTIAAASSASVQTGYNSSHRRKPSPLSSLCWQSFRECLGLTSRPPLQHSKSDLRSVQRQQVKDNFKICNLSWHVLFQELRSNSLSMYRYRYDGERNEPNTLFHRFVLLRESGSQAQMDRGGSSLFSLFVLGIGFSAYLLRSWKRCSLPYRRICSPL